MQLFAGVFATAIAVQIVLVGIVRAVMMWAAARAQDDEGGEEGGNS